MRIKNKYPFVYLRVAASDRIVVVVNPSGRACSVTDETMHSGSDTRFPIINYDYE
jgi:hypothetical protein